MTDFRSGSDHLHAASDAALAVDYLPAFFRPHAGAKPDLADTLALGELVGLMHELVVPVDCLITRFF